VLELLEDQVNRRPTEGEGDTCSVLIVDDDEKVCRTLRRVVEGFGCRVETATSGAEGLACVVGEKLPATNTAVARSADGRIL